MGLGVWLCDQCTCGRVFDVGLGVFLLDFPLFV